MTGVHPEAHSAATPWWLDHVALRVAGPEAMASFLSQHLALRQIDRTHDLTVLGADPEGGKLVLRRAEGPLDPGALARLVFRVADLQGALASLPRGVDVKRPVPELATFEGPEGLGLGLTQVFGGTDYDLDHVVLSVAAPDQVALGMAGLGFVFRGGVLHVADKQVRLEQRPLPPGERPRLSHIGVLVESAEAVESQARQAGLEVDPSGDALGKLAMLVPGPERIRIEYLEQGIGLS